MIKRREASLVTVAADELSERKIGCRFMQGHVHFSKAPRNANRELANALQILPPHSIHRVTEALERLMEEDAAADPGTHINAPESCRPPYRPIRSVATGPDF